MMFNKKLGICIFFVFFGIILISGCVKNNSSENFESFVPEVNKYDIELGVEMNHFLEDIDKANELGAKIARVPLRWEEVEPTKGEYNFEKFDEIVDAAEKANINLLFTAKELSSWATVAVPTTGGPYLASSPAKDINDWKNLLTLFVNRYKDRDIEISYEIENEVNSPAFWNGTIDEYVFVLKESYSTIKSVDSNTIVLAASFACGVTKNIPNDKITQTKEEFELDLEKILDSKSFDVLSVHNYYYPGKEVNEYTFESYLGDIKNKMIEKNIDKEIWITEFGFVSTNTKVGSREDVGSLKIQAENFRDAYDSAGKNGVKKMFWIIIEDRSESFFGSMGLFNANGSKRPSGELFTLLSKD